MFGNIFMRFKPRRQQLEASLARVTVRRAQCSNEAGILERVRRSWLQDGLVPRLLFTDLLLDPMYLLWCRHIREKNWNKRTKGEPREQPIHELPGRVAPGNHDFCDEKPDAADKIARRDEQHGLLERAFGR